MRAADSNTERGPGRGHRSLNESPAPLSDGGVGVSAKIKENALRPRKGNPLRTFLLLGILAAVLVLACASSQPSQKAAETETTRSQTATPDTATYEEKVLFAYPAVVVNRRINLRSGPGTTYAVTETLSGGQSVTVVSESGDWVKVLVERDNRMGWIHRSLIRRKK